MSLAFLTSCSQTLVYYSSFKLPPSPPPPHSFLPHAHNSPLNSILIIFREREGEDGSEAGGLCASADGSAGAGCIPRIAADHHPPPSYLNRRRPQRSISPPMGFIHHVWPLEEWCFGCSNYTQQHNGIYAVGNNSHHSQFSHRRICQHYIRLRQHSI
ncbi:hypothetical protein FF1_019035 [Malus domestica]